MRTFLGSKLFVTNETINRLFLEVRLPNFIYQVWK